MPLPTGTQLGPYEVTAALGAGGMGEVYRARDTRLDRSVAIKVLAPAVAQDAERRSRFEREAKAIAALTHPHICTLHDVGQHDGIAYLVMELVDGQTLAARLEKGALPLPEALTIASQVADALAAAHRLGIVHRDIKPANVMLTKSGVKLLDFGLAKLHPTTGPVTLGAGSQTGTATATGTAEGTILGTIHYMAPEQIEGKDADHRTDIWALGAVLYEMVTGVRPFQGDTAAGVLGAILKETPPAISARQPLSPALLEQLVARCLDKDVEARWQSAADVRHALAWCRSIGGSSPGDPASRRAPRAGWIIATAAAVVAASIAPDWLAHRREPAPQVSRLAILPPPNTSLSAPPASIVSAQVSLSPDGRLVAMVAQVPGGRPGIWVRPVDSEDARPLAGTEDATYPFWSPDARALGFFSRGKLKTIELAGGPPTTLTDAPLDTRGGTWNAEGTILFAPVATDVIHRISAKGGASEPVTKFDESRGERSHRFPWFLPDGRHFIYTVRGERAGEWGISLASLDSPEGRVLLTGTDWAAQVVEPGILLYLRGPSLVAHRLDLKTLALSGEPATIAERVGTTATGYASFSASNTGELILAGPPALGGELRWYDRTGIVRGAASEPASYLDFELAPDEQSLAVSRVDEQTATGDVWTADLARNVWTRLTTDRANDASALWSPDGRQIAFRSNRVGNSDVYRKSSNGSAAEVRFFGLQKNNLVASDWSADGRHVVFTNVSAASGFSIWAWPTSGQGEASLVVQRPLNAMHGRLSPDGRWLAYASDESGEWQVYVQPFPGTGADDRKQVSSQGGSEPRWRGDGRELFFLAADHRMMSVDMQAGNAMAAGAPKALFQTKVPLTGNPYRSNYTVTRDGQRFLVNAAVEAGLTSPFTIIQRFPTLLNQ